METLVLWMVSEGGSVYNKEGEKYLTFDQTTNEKRRYVAQT